MADTFTKQRRSEIMGRITSKDTQPEKRVRSTLHRMGLRFRLHGTALPVKPDEEHGFHNPGVETFKGNLERYLAREVIQNSVDARHDPAKPVQVSFDLRDLKPGDIPGLDDLAATFQRCADFWNKDKRAREFFDRAYEITQGDTIPCLRLRDCCTRRAA